MGLPVRLTDDEPSLTTAFSPAVDREAWLKERRSGIGASEAPIVMGITGSRIRLFLEKTDEIERQPPSDRMEIGLDLEPVIAKWYERRTGRKIRCTQRFLRHPQYDWVIATLDAITECGRVVEFKSCDVFGPYGRQVVAGEVPDVWRVQVNQQLTLARAAGEADGEEGDLAVWMNNDLRICPVVRSEALWQHTADAIEQFWFDHVLAGVMPEYVVPTDAALLAKVFCRRSGKVLAMGADFGRWARKYQEAGRQIGELEDDRDLARARMLLAMGNADGAGTDDGVYVERKVSKDGKVRLYVRDNQELKGDQE